MSFAGQPIFIFTGRPAYWLSELAGAALRFLPIILIAFLLPVPYRMTLPAGPLSLLLFLVTLLTGLLINVSISMFIYIMTIVTLSPLGPMLLLATLGEFMAGMVLPIPLMPAWLQGIVYLLPFHLTADLPFRIYSGHIGPAAAFAGLVQQVGWLAVLLVLGQLAMRKILSRVVVQGG